LQFDTQYSGGSGIVCEVFQPVSSEQYSISKQKNILHILTVSILLV